MITGNEPANPHGAWGQQTGTGETLLEKWSAMAMQGILASFHSEKNITSQCADGVAYDAVRCAKALIEKLNKSV